MRRLVVSEFVTVDGVMDGPGGDPGAPRGGWAFQFNRGEEGNKFKLDELMASDALLLGRVTYEGFAKAWPGRTDEQGFADKFNTMTKYVVSSTLTEPLEWANSHLLKGDLVEEVTKLKQQDGGDIMVNGSARLVSALADNDLVDAYHLMVFPTVLGAGKRLFADTREAMPLRLTEAKPVGPAGVMTMIYERAR
ncbi:MAG: dihydrofolate reductase family protein [Solirubrobacteraceae bacterium]